MCNHPCHRRSSLYLPHFQLWRKKVGFSPLLEQGATEQIVQDTSWVARQLVLVGMPSRIEHINDQYLVLWDETVETDFRSSCIDQNKFCLFVSALFTCLSEPASDRWERIILRLSMLIKLLLTHSSCKTSVQNLNKKQLSSYRACLPL